MSEKRKDSMKTIVNEEKGVVTVVIKGCEKDALNSILSRFDLDSLGLVNSLDNAYVGVARCNPEDKFDRNIGGDLASKRAMDKHKKAHTKAIKDWQYNALRLIRDVCPRTFDEIIKSKARELRFKGEI
ncbi:MAG: hypothetical protein IJZ36_02230 [Bacilli bacterium]|nr:hypothetical protein [Bacilli bacterium]